MTTLSKIPINYDWSFSDKTIKDTAYITHGYYTYPAKFIPQLASRLIKEHSLENDIVIDPFMGSGTTIIEAMVNSRVGIGTDINEIATLISKVKSTPIDCSKLTNEYITFIWTLQHKLNGNLKNELNNISENINLPQRIDYWFKPHIKHQLMIILDNILKIKNIDIRDFFLVAFSQILKSCSIWMQKSVKPMRDTNKKDIDPLLKFEWQIKRMIKKQAIFNETIPKSVLNNIDKYRKAKNGDARNLPCESNKATLIVTSPPYVTSYEYADLHQLPSLWLGYLEELSIFRKKFIGSSYREKNKTDIQSKMADDIVLQLGNGKKEKEVHNYFSDMLESFIEMKRVLKKGGKTAVVIGNTKLKGVEILNAEVFQEQLENIGFKTYDIIHREIPSKMLPSTRDPRTGKFTVVTNDNKELVYPTEYILVMEKA